LEAEDMVS